MTKSLQISFPPPYALPKTLENYMKVSANFCLIYEFINFLLMKDEESFK